HRRHAPGRDPLPRIVRGTAGSPTAQAHARRQTGDAIMSREDERTLSTADLAGVNEAAQAHAHGELAQADHGDRMTQVETRQRETSQQAADSGATQAEPLAELFPKD